MSEMWFLRLRLCGCVNVKRIFSRCWFQTLRSTIFTAVLKDMCNGVAVLRNMYILCLGSCPETKGSRKSGEAPAKLPFKIGVNPSHLRVLEAKPNGVFPSRHVVSRPCRWFCGVSELGKKP